MNLAYFRNSNFTLEESLNNIKKEAKKLDLQVTGTQNLPSLNGTIVYVSSIKWTQSLINLDQNLIGLLPCAVVIYKKDNNITLGSGNPTILGSISQNPEVKKLAIEAETVIKTLIEKSAGVGPRIVEKLKLYSTTTCPYCKLEASWLDEKKIKYDEVHVDINQKEAEDMVQKTGQMGVPVTQVQYEGGEVEYIVGFNKPELTKILNITN